MKKYIAFASTALLIACMSLLHSCQGQSSQQQLLKDLVSQLSKQCPLQEEPMGKLTGISIDKENGLTAQFALKPSLWQWLSDSTSQASKDLLKKNMIYTMVNSPRLSQLVALLTESGQDLNVNFKSPQPGKDSSLTISGKDLKQPVDSQAPIDLQIMLTNRTLPAPLDSIITLTKLFKDGDFLTYYYEVDDDELNMELMEEKKAEFKAELAANFTNTDKALLDPIYLAGMTLRYSYNDKESRKVVNIDFTAAEIDSIRKTGN